MEVTPHCDAAGKESTVAFGMATLMEDCLFVGDIWFIEVHHIPRVETLAGYFGIECCVPARR